MTTCPFCNSDNRKIWQDALCQVVFADEPDYPGFCRVVTHQHIKEMTDLPKAAQWQLMRVVFCVESAMRETLRPDKINLASLGNQVPHLHWHIIPRYVDDKHFPNPIWTTPTAERYPKYQPLETLAALTHNIREKLSDISSY